MMSTLCQYKAGYDFKRLFAVSVYYDRDRPTFYRSIQSVRDKGMDMTAWLDFVTGPETQRAEVRERSERVIRRDVLWCNSPASTCGRPRFWGISAGTAS